MPAPASLPEGLQPLVKFIQLRQAMTREQFLEAYPHPFLIIPMAEGMGDVGKLDDFDTLPVTAPQPGDRWAERMVAAVAKRVGDNFPNFIWIGREPQCDVSLPHGGISKLHAQLIRRPSGEYEILDTNSSNGTFVDGKRLDGNTPARVADGARIRLGTLECVFRSAEGFWNELGGMDGSVA